LFLLYSNTYKLPQDALDVFRAVTNIIANIYSHTYSLVVLLKSTYLVKYEILYPI
jgi:hypothetical protein